jgi:fatty-acyl-CoA synthase
VLVDVTLIGGGTVVLDAHFDAARTLAMIEAERITDLFLVEPQLFAMMDHADVARRDLSSLRRVTHIGGSAPAILRRRAMARLGPVLTHVYGASEAGLISMLSPDECSAMPGLLASAGRVREGVQLRLRRADGQLAHGGECGRIEVKSAAVAQGYRNMPDEDALKFRDGWCLTGDVGFIDRDGYVQILGRAADVAEIDARTIGPAQIEDVLCRLPDVRYAVAFTTSGAPGWLVALEAWRGERIDIARCASALKASLGACVAQKVRVAVIDRVPLTEQGKADRAAIEKAVRGRGETVGLCVYQ